MPKSNGHRWQYHELPPVAPTEGARPAQKCARCGMVRQPWPDTPRWYQYTRPDGFAMHYAEYEPPCENSPAKPAGGP